ncbi:MAG: response regulator [Elusimicrobia bacterium]|nr:response regulator [Elusimicrobiota bacterium]
MKTILVIDDEPEILDLVRISLERESYRCATCSSGRLAWETIQQEKPDLIILDVMLPGIDGYSLQLKMSQDENTKKIPIIVLTALEPSRTLFRKFPQVSAFMTKPFRAEELLENVRTAFHSVSNR